LVDLLGNLVGAKALFCDALDVFKLV
jgi:hypothetical protein